MDPEPPKPSSLRRELSFHKLYCNVLGLERDQDSFSPGKQGLDELLSRNREWASEMTQKNPTFFSRLADQQAPELLWIGCSDSRVPSNQLLKLPPGEVFVHRNIANQVGGHYGCGGVNAALSQQEYGLVDNWLRNIKDLYDENSSKFKGLTDIAKSDLLTELNVAKSVFNVCHTRIIQNAWENGQELSVHGWCYRLVDGIIRDLKICINGEDQVEEIYRRMMKKKKPET